MNGQSPKSPQVKDRLDGFNEVSNQLGRAFAVYFTWLSVGLLDRKEEKPARDPLCDRSCS
ncbi:MAG: hypothetical protein F6J93_03065 [Oscillatoria sp. SIO1A7]|nr:hypothetical protein [Oscillatoria sp. SIO1A7]